MRGWGLFGERYRPGAGGGGLGLPEQPHYPHPRIPLPSPCLRALQLRLPSLARGARTPPSPPAPLPLSEPEPGIPRPCTSPGARPGRGAAGRQSRRGGEAGARLGRAGGASWRGCPREPQTRAQTPTDASTGGRAGRHRQSTPAASPGPGGQPSRAAAPPEEGTARRARPRHVSGAAGTWSAALRAGGDNARRPHLTMECALLLACALPAARSSPPRAPAGLGRVVQAGARRGARREWGGPGAPGRAAHAPRAGLSCRRSNCATSAARRSPWP